MKRDDAILAMDTLARQGYVTSIIAIPTPPDHMPWNGEAIHYRVTVDALSFDKVDLRHLCDQADELGLEVYASKINGQGTIEFTERDDRPEVTRNPRKHPRSV